MSDLICKSEGSGSSEDTVEAGSAVADATAGKHVSALIGALG